MPQPGQEVFFNKMHEWSERKLQLLKKYVDAADKILGSINQIYYQGLTPLLVATHVDREAC